ncbi:MAG: FtsX-like permease family protein [Planctomycetota bacterium]
MGDPSVSLTSFLACRSWASSPLRTALTVLGIALGVAIVVAIYVMDHNTIKSRQLEQNPDLGPVDLVVWPRDGARSAGHVREDLAGRGGVARVGLWLRAKATLSARGRSCDVTVFGLDPLPTGPFGHYQVAAGRDLSPQDGEGAVLLGQEAARLLGVGPGDRIGFAMPDAASRVECRDGELRVVEEPGAGPRFSREVLVAGILTRDRVGRRDFAQVAVASHALASRAQRLGPDQFQVQRVYGADLDRLRAELESDYVAQDLRAAMIGEGADERAFRNGLKVLGCLALLLGMFSVFQTLSQSLVARVRQLGLLRCLGLERRRVALAFLADALGMGVAGSALGIALGLAFAFVLKQARISSLGLGKEWHTFEVPLVPVLWTAGLGVLFTLAGALFPLFRASRIPPMAVLRSAGQPPDRRGPADLQRGVNLWLFGMLVVALPLAYLAMTPLVSEEGRETLFVLLEMFAMLVAFGGLLLLSPPLVVLLGRILLWPMALPFRMAGYLARKTLTERPARLAASVSGLSAVLLALLGLKSLTASLRAEVRLFAGQALDGRVFLELDPVTKEAAMTLRKVEGVRAVEPQEGLATPGFLLSGLSIEAIAGPEGALERDLDLQRRYTDRSRRSLVASRRLAAKMGWRAGHIVPLRDRNGTPRAYDVLLISDRSGYQPSERAWAVADPYWIRKDFCVGGVERIALRLSDGADPDITADRAKAALHGVRKCFTGDWIRDYHLRDVTRDFFLFDLLVLMMLVLAGMSLLNGMTIAALARIREIGVLRALGVSTRTLRGSFLLEGALVGLLAALVALGFCWPVARVLIEGLNRVAFLDAPLEMPRPWMVAVPFMALGTGLVAAVVPGMRAARISPSESVRYE